MFEKSPYLVRAINNDLLHLNKNISVSDNLIEIIPHDKSVFDNITFIEFSPYTKFQYVVLQIDGNDKVTSIELYDVEPLHLHSPQKIKYSFKIEIGCNFSFIRIFMKHYLNDYNEK